MGSQDLAGVGFCVCQRKGLITMSISTCCKARVKYDYKLNENEESGLEIIVVCQSCGKSSGEYNPPCSTCGSDDPCSCSNGSDDAYYPTYDKSHEDEMDKLLANLENSDNPRDKKLLDDLNRISPYLDKPTMLTPENSPEVKTMRTEIFPKIELEIKIDKEHNQAEITIHNLLRNKSTQFRTLTIPQAYAVIENLRLIKVEEQSKQRKKMLGNEKFCDWMKREFGIDVHTIY